MHRDMKIGLALGLLLIGAVAAFFFRNEPAGDPRAPQLNQPDEIAVKLKDKEGPKPYLEEPAPKVQKPSQEDNPFAFESTLTQSNQETADPFHNVFAETPRENPAETEQTNPWLEEEVPRPIQNRPPRDLRGLSPFTQASADTPQASQRQPRSQSPDTSVRTHTVGKGETLSSLATSYLGSETRFMEIYEYNRDVLDSPHQLQLGMTLRIPPRQPSRSAEEGIPATSVSLQQPVPTSPPQKLRDSTQFRENDPAKRLLLQQPPAGPPQGERRDVFGDSKNSGQYRVRPGDSLEKIALRVYGRRTAVDELYAANRTLLSDPDLLQPGMLLKLPPLD